MINKSQENDRMYFYETFAEDFDSKVNMYDTNMRLKVFYNELLKEDLTGKKLLDAGCGTGWFSKAAVERGASVVSMDLGEGLLSQVAKKCNTERVVGSILDIPFPENTFDLVVSSEVIEHTPNPKAAIREMQRVLKPGGILILSTPNKIWYFAIWFANTFKLRPYQGLENWTSWWKMKRYLSDAELEVEQMVGIHLFPFIHPLLYPILNFFHHTNRLLGPIMLNIAVKAKKII